PSVLPALEFKQKQYTSAAFPVVPTMAGGKEIFGRVRGESFGSFSSTAGKRSTMNASELPWPTGLLRPTWYAPAPKSAGKVRSNCSASAFPSPPGGEGGVRGLDFGLATRLPTIFGLEHV